MDIQALMNTISDVARDTRKSYHMTIDSLTEMLEHLHDRTIPVYFDFGVKTSVGDLDSYRGYYSDLSLQPSDHVITAEQLYVKLKQAHGQTFEGYKGGKFVMDGDTPLWTAHYGDASGIAIIDARVDSGRLLLITKTIN